MLNLLDGFILPLIRRKTTLFFLHLPTKIKPVKFYIIAGEASGDLHGSNLVKALKAQQPQSEFRGWGGEHMQEAGVDLVKHYKDTAFMGFIEVVKNLKTIRSLFAFCRKDIFAYKPDALILVDYPGFNLRMAPFAQEHKIPVYFYISPQVWAWKANRVEKIRKYVDRLYVILPFEKDFFKERDYEVDFVGHPLLDVIDKNATNDDKQKTKIALLPGSRKQEISILLPLMIEVSKQFPEETFELAGVPSNGAGFYHSFVLPDNVELTMGKTYDILQRSKAAIVTSGTATLETALFNVPQVVVYKGNWMTYQIGKRLIKIDYISLVNLVLDRKLVEELLQDRADPKLIQEELNALLNNSEKRATIFKGYEELKIKLGGPGASARTAELIHHSLKMRNDSANNSLA